MTLVAARDLAVARGGIPLLTGLTFTLEAGQALVLRGPNGLGKTTLLRTIAGLQPPLDGHLTVAAEAVAYGAHQNGTKAALTVAENLRFWAEVYGTRATDDVMARMNLGGLADRPAAQLSAGQGRRLALARMLVTGRPLWVLDEPTVSLDAASVTLWGEVMRGHLAAGGAAVIATHIDLGLPEARVMDLTPFKARFAAAPA